MGNQSGFLSIVAVMLPVIALAGVAGYFLLKHALKTPIQKQQLQTNTKYETLNWKTYRNEKYGFEIKYPNTLEALEGQALTYKPPQLTSVANICFAPVNRLEFYCEFELYVTEEIEKFTSESNFLGLRVLPQNVSFVPFFDGVVGKNVDVDRSSVVYKNVFVRKGNRIFLLTMDLSIEPTSARIDQLRSMIDSFEFIKLQK